MKKQWAAATGACVLAASMAVQAQDRGNLLQHIGRAITGAPQVSRDRAKSPYLDPQGTYWDLDQDELAGATSPRF
ncbi:hypothetical protein [Xanthomonas sp. 3058]|uniref:hypothetical protein n=1 Tax=Xanthomonas sp. 3058 TaxID=3035314 RepID=UPI0017F69A77|nr:hypothetical protein [Xanthomonas sp. 3058]MBB5863260.1 hypothetical protein [Xanthomonas sp. 3058]